MKKFRFLLALGLALALLFVTCSCSEKIYPSCRDILAAMTSSEAGLPAGRLYSAMAEAGESEFLDDSLLAALYGGGSLPAVSEDWLDCAVFLPSSSHPCELAVFLCSSHDAASDTARLLCSRLRSLKNAKSTCEEFSLMLESASVTICGNFVLFIVSSDTQNSLKIAKSLIS